MFNLFHLLSEHKPEFSLSKPGDQNSIEKRIFPVLDEVSKSTIQWTGVGDML